MQDVFDSDGVGLPRLMGVAGAAAMGLVGALVASADPTPLRIGLALVMVSPWMLDLSRWSLPRLPFAVVAALAAWALIGNTSSSLAEATLIYLATYMGFVGTLPESLLVLALCAAWPLRGAWVQRHIVSLAAMRWMPLMLSTIRVVDRSWLRVKDTTYRSSPS